MEAVSQTGYVSWHLVLWTARVVTSAAMTSAVMPSAMMTSGAMMRLSKFWGGIRLLLGSLVQRRIGECTQDALFRTLRVSVYGILRKVQVRCVFTSFSQSVVLL